MSENEVNDDLSLNVLSDKKPLEVIWDDDKIERVSWFSHVVGSLVMLKLNLTITFSDPTPVY